jgi:cell division initiation protein
MKLTPLDIRHKEFRRAVRGYSDEEVDVFLDEVADGFERLFQDNIELGERQRQLEEQVEQYERIKETLNKTLVSAQQQADETRSNAHKEADLILRDAELKARGIVNEAYAEKQKVQQSLIQLRQGEEDFRFKFRSLLEAHLNLLAEDEAAEDRRGFRGLVGDLNDGSSDDKEDSTDESPAAAAPSAGFVGSEDLGAGNGGLEVTADDFLPEGQDSGDVIAESGREPSVSFAAPPAADSEADAVPPIKRFIFGKKGSEDDDLFEGDGGRDFEW